MIPHTRPPDSKSRLARSFRCCPNCGPVIGAPFLWQNRFERPSGSPFKALSLAACPNRWHFAVQISFAQNLIWTAVVENLPHKGAAGLALAYARIRAVLLANRLPAHFHVAHAAGWRPAHAGAGFVLCFRKGPSEAEALVSARP